MTIFPLVPPQARNGSTTVMRQVIRRPDQKSQKGRWKGMDADQDFSDDQVRARSQLIARDLIAKDLEGLNRRVAACCVNERQS